MSVKEATEPQGPTPEGAEEMPLTSEEDAQLEAYWAWRHKQEVQANPADPATA